MSEQKRVKVMLDRPLSRKEHEARVRLYNAACAYGAMVRGKGLSYGATMKIALDLEESAIAFSEMIKPATVATSS